jgi:hypothetical protein
MFASFGGLFGLVTNIGKRKCARCHSIYFSKREREGGDRNHSNPWQLHGSVNAYASQMRTHHV